MIYNTEIQSETKQAMERLLFLAEKGKVIELKEVRKIRSIPQNSYLHLILSLFALEYGETLEFTKRDIFKKHVNPEIFKTKRTNPKNKKTRDHWRSTSELNTKELSTAIDKFRNWSSKEAEIYLPEANEDLNYIKREIEKNKQWL